jgi:hypothetical protein
LQFQSSKPITITNVFLTTGLDAQGNPLPAVEEFLKDQSRIYCIVTIQAPKPIRVGVRWFYQDRLFADQAQTISTTGIWFLESTAEQKFRAGQYRVEVYLIESALRTKNFSVK